jgi:hypothetical protein
MKNITLKLFSIQHIFFLVFSFAFYVSNAQIDSTKKDKILQKDTISHKENRHLYIGLDVGRIALTNFTSVPLSLRYKFNNAITGVVSFGYDNYNRLKFFGTRVPTTYQNTGGYINVGIDYKISNKNNDKTSLVLGTGLIYSRFSEKVNYTFAGSSFDDYKGELKRDFNLLAVEFRFGVFYQIWRKLYGYSGLKVAFSEVRGNDFQELPVNYIPGIGLNWTAGYSVFPTVEIKAFYKIF